MAIYVTSDIHGNFNALQRLLSLIKFSDNDELYIIGDIVDRGAEIVKTMEFVKNTPNIHMMMGNHEHMMLEAFYHIPGARSLWDSNGGLYTARELFELDKQVRDEYIEWASKLPYTLTVNVNGQDFLLGHARPWAINKENIVWERVYLCETAPNSNYIYIAGHTPTFVLEHYKDGIYGADPKIMTNKDNRLYFIDCGAAYQYPNIKTKLACLRLDDLQEFYVPAFV